jgi:hypothetical protein
MTDTERSRFAELLALLGEVFNEPVTAARVTGYCLALDDLPFPDVKRGIETALRECRFFPKPAEIRTLASAGFVDAAWVNRMLSEAISGHEVSPFIAMFVDRLGGIHAVEDRLPNDRISLVRAMYPGIVAACRARGIPIPTVGELAGPGERRLLEERTRLLVEQFESPDDEDPED